MYKSILRQLTTHNGRMYELFYWLSKGTDWMGTLKKWIDKKEYEHWSKWVDK